MGYMREENIIGFIRDLRENLINFEDAHGDEFGISFEDSYQ